MANIAEILKREDSNQKNIFLYSSGIFYHAYNRSAWLSCHLLHDFTVLKHFVKIVNRPVATIGFPKTSLEKWGTGLTAELTTEGLTIAIADEKLPATDDYDNWFERIPLTEKKQKDDEQPSTDKPAKSKNAKLDDIYREIGYRVARFPLESKSPLECMLFVARLRQMINNE